MANLITDFIEEEKTDTTNTKQRKTINDFIQNELREYATYDNERSIPSIVDGLKT